MIMFLFGLSMMRGVMSRLPKYIASVVISMHFLLRLSYRSRCLIWKSDLKKKKKKKKKKKLFHVRILTDLIIQIC